MLTRIKDQKISCVYIHVYQITKNWGPSPYNSLCHDDNRRYFSCLSPTWNWTEAHVLLCKGSGKIWTCSCWEKGNFIMINEFKYGQTWKIWSSPLSLSLYSTFKTTLNKIFPVQCCLEPLGQHDTRVFQLLCGPKKNKTTLKKIFDVECCLQPQGQH